MISRRLATALITSLPLLTATFLGAPREVAASTTVSPAEVVAKITGGGSTSQTDTRYQLLATDLGIMWDNGAGQILTAFGDTYGNGWGGSGAGPTQADWRCNVLGRSSDHVLGDGMLFDDMVLDRAGHAGQLLPCQKINNLELTVIPTAGIAIGSRNYMHYMSINHWGAAGQWFTNHAGIAYSDNNGATWIKPSSAKWTNTSASDHPFQVGAFAREGGYLYLFGTPNGRFGDVHLARVPEANVLDANAYQYWDGTAWRTGNAAVAAPIVIGPVGELSVQYNTFARAYLMTYLNEARHAVVMREAPSLRGPWSGERLVAMGGAGDPYPGLYGGFMHPWSSTSGTSALYFSMSMWGPYNAFLMRTYLTVSAGALNLLSDPGLEEQRSASASPPFRLSGTGGIDRGLNNAHSGANNGWVRANQIQGFQSLTQSVTVRPNTSYRLSGWIRSSAANTDGYFGARGINGGAVIKEMKFGSLPGYTQLTVDFNAGNNRVVDVYTGVWGNGGDAWAQVDDLVLVEIPNLVADGGFEDQAGAAAASPWRVGGTGGVDRNLGFSHFGANDGWVRGTLGWNDIAQTIAVKPNTSYRLSAWVQTASGNTDGYFGARTGSSVVKEVKFGTLPGYEQITVDFASGALTSVDVYGGLWGNSSNPWARLDDVTLTELP